MTIMLLAPFTILGQCPGDAFKTGDFTDWDKHIGYKGFGVGVETIITPYTSSDSFRFKVNRDTSAVDLQIGSLLKVIPSGYDYSIRLGDYINGAKAERMSYEWVVDANSNILYYKYAIVSQQPNHAAEWLPTVAFLVRDQNDSIIECSQQTIIPGYTNIPLLTANSGSNQLRYTEWRTVAIDLSPYEGETLRFEAVNSDCGLGQHFSYSYFVVDCGSKLSTAHFCEGNSDVEVIGPPGFDAYQWSTGEVAKNITVSNATAGDTINCLATTFTCTTAFEYIIESSAIIAEFESTFDTAAMAAQLESATETVNSSIASLLWDFGDGNISTKTNPLHVYDSFGVFQITLIAESSKGCRDTTSIPFINYPPPYPEFNAKDSCGLKTSFINLTLPPIVGEITGYKWDFGDDSYSTESNPTHRYEKSGEYQVSLSAVSSNVQEASISKRVRVYDSPVVKFSSEAACIGNPTAFFNESFIETGDSLVFDWNFGSNQASTLVEPVITFEKPKVIQVDLKATSPFHCINTASREIEIFPKTVSASFEYNPTEVDVMNPVVTFKSTSANATKWTWRMDSTVFSKKTDPTFQFMSDTGTYTIELEVENEYGCVYSVRENLSIKPQVSVYIPNAFSPDSDGINDGFIIRAEGIRNAQWTIYNRWGATILVSSKLNTEIQLPEVNSNVLFYEMTFEDDNGRQYQRSGTISVIK